MRLCAVDSARFDDPPRRVLGLFGAVWFGVAGVDWGVRMVSHGGYDD